MAIDIVKFIKGILVKNDTDTSKQMKIEVSSSATTATTTTLQSAQTSNVTVTLPNATDTLVGRATTDTLTNKTLTSPVINTPTGIVKADVGLGNVDNTSDATKNAATATLTNKTIDGGSNTITNVIATNVSGTVAIANGGTGQTTQQAAIDALAGAVTSAQYLRGDGTHVSMSAIQASDIPTLNQNTTGTASNVSGTVAVNHGGTGQTTTSAAFDTLAPTVGKGDLIVRNSTTNTSVSVGTDGQVLVADASQSTGVKWAAIQAGAKNYISNNNFETNSTSGWSTFTTTMTGVVPTGTISNGAASITIFQPTATNPLAGTYSLQVQGSPTFPAGQGFYTQFTPDREDRAKVLQVSFNYEFVSATGSSDFSGTSANTFHVYIYDVTNSAWIQPAGVYGMTQKSGAGKLSATFQTNSTAATYNLVVLCANTASGTTTMNFDDFSVGPQIVTQGAAITDFIDAVPATIIGSGSGSLTIGTGGGAIYSVKTRRVGANLELRYEVRIGTSGASDITAGTYIFPYPSGITTALNSYSVIGYGDITAVASATPTNRVVAKVYASGFILDSADSGLLATSGNLFNNANMLSVLISIPVTGWSSNVQLSSDTDTRVVAASYRCGSGQSLTSTGIIKFDTKVSDTHGAYNTTTGVYTAPVAGLYKVNYFLTSITATAQATIQLRKNGTTQVRVAAAPQYSGGTSIVNNQSVMIQNPYIMSLNAGDTVDVYNSVALGTGSLYSADIDNYLSIERLSGPSTIAASETVSFSANTSTTAGTTSTPFIYTTKEHDTHNAYSTSTGKFTAPIAGKYCFQFNNFGGATTFQAKLHKNGTAVYQGSSTVAMVSVGSGSHTISMLAGDTMEVRPETNATASGGATTNTFSGFRVGN